MASILTAVGIFITLGIAVANLWYSYTNAKKTGFINTVTSSRIQWISSLRDKVTTFIAVTTRLTGPEMLETPKPEEEAAINKEIIALMRERDTLMHQIILHLNPEDPEDQAIKICVEKIFRESEAGIPTQDVADLLIELRDTTGNYLKKEWEKVKNESEQGRLSKSTNEQAKKDKAVKAH